MTPSSLISCWPSQGISIYVFFFLTATFNFFWLTTTLIWVSAPPQHLIHAPTFLWALREVFCWEAGVPGLVCTDLSGVSRLSVVVRSIRKTQVTLLTERSHRTDAMKGREGLKMRERKIDERSPPLRHRPSWDYLPWTFFGSWTMNTSGRFSSVLSQLCFTLERHCLGEKQKQDSHCCSYFGCSQERSFWTVAISWSTAGGNVV